MGSVLLEIMKPTDLLPLLGQGSFVFLSPMSLRHQQEYSEGQWQDLLRCGSQNGKPYLSMTFGVHAPAMAV
jgi:hypothetical protein